MISSSSDSCSKLVAGNYDVSLDENPEPTKRILKEFLAKFDIIELESRQDSNDGYSRRFQQLKELSKNLKLNKENLIDGELEYNIRKNRYQDIIPFNHTRVVLRCDPNIPGSGYINANFISGSSGSPKAYIACQGPLKRTLNDFWRMIWECNVSVIVMACNEYESGQSKCELYWPECTDMTCTYGNLDVTLVKVRQTCEDFCIRKFTVKLIQTNPMSKLDNSVDDKISRSDGDSDSYQNSETQEAYPSDGKIVLEERTICQFHYTTWPDHGVPQSVQPILELLRLVRDVQPAEDKPILIHCSAGCGRTGTICCIDYVWGLLRRSKLESNFDLHCIISEMRRQRMSMVQTLDQYVLCYRAVAALFIQQLSILDDQVDGDLEFFQLPEKEDVAYDIAFEGDENYGPVFI